MNERIRLSEIKNKVIEYLWQIIDDISTVGDIAKNNDKLYRKMVEELQVKRNDTGITSDGYKLDYSKMVVPEKRKDILPDVYDIKENIIKSEEILDNDIPVGSSESLQEIIDKKVISNKPKTEKLGMKFDKGKLKMSLFPIQALEEVLKVLLIGSEKYEPENWKSVKPFETIYMDANYRHNFEYQKYLETGDKKYLVDEDTGLFHKAHSICNDIFILWKQIQDIGIDNETWRIKLQEVREKYKKDREKFQNKD